ncbi:MAG: Asp23/Gls24 family envelope stress response protein [Christensenellaceae bacterium]|nr:Asp23/Gls24 family envelope stress response protein [Christensenellaceae bacterium]MDY2851789.1 Asp23/Gls24 family envelope stress response protein [Christensenellaceae bacterium]
MAENKKSLGVADGKVVYNAGIVKGIVALAVSEIAGVAISAKKKRSGGANDAIRLKFSDRGINVDVNITVYTGFKVPDVAFNVQQNIKQSVESMSEYKINEVNVHVDNVITDVDAITEQ